MQILLLAGVTVDYPKVTFKSSISSLEKLAGRLGKFIKI